MICSDTSNWTCSNSSWLDLLTIVSRLLHLYILHAFIDLGTGSSSDRYVICCLIIYICLVWIIHISGMITGKNKQHNSIGLYAYYIHHFIGHFVDEPTVRALILLKNTLLVQHILPFFCLELLQPFYSPLDCPYHKGKTRNVKPIWIYWSKR